MIVFIKKNVYYKYLFFNPKKYSSDETMKKQLKIIMTHNQVLYENKTRAVCEFFFIDNR